MESLKASVDLRVLQAMSMEAFKDSLKAHETVASLLTEQSSETIFPEHIGQRIDISA